MSLFEKRNNSQSKMKCDIKKLMIPRSGIITQCRTCQRIGLTYKNLIIGFTPGEFNRSMKVYNI
ncbi:DUF6686 family protein [Fulvivirga marina]|uniref:DUF6686 family protein n=1 Tax=Fulvivirga marina TaxID=2494733 RepID=UPI0037432046